MKPIALLATLLCCQSALAAPVPDFLDPDEINNATFTCLDAPAEYSPEAQPYVDQLWDETLKYLEAYAVALSSTDGNCRHSDLSMVETNTHDLKGPQYMCIMDQRDMQLMVKHIYAVINNPDKAKACFGAREDVDWIYSPGGELERRSPVAQWLNRTTFSEFFETKVTDPEVQAYGREFTKHFAKMVTGDDLVMPKAFPYDVSANALPNLWASVGWFPMYAEESQRNLRNFDKTRGSYAYAEVFGHWGLLRIEAINGEKVGAEVGMVTQRIDSFYPYHNHAISEIYYTIREPACADEFQNFAVRENSPLVKTLSETDTLREVEFDAGMDNEAMFWTSTSPHKDDLVYFHQNTIHAFNYNGADCHAKPEEKAIVTVWARSNAHDKRNDYGTTRLCESSERPDTPAMRGEAIRCDLTKTKY
ncbi:hypothetical protein [Ferrimonas balearica]|uniref:hypothetical protein n=1 Tax=Ferrimonas balearica TaxID=44012 RepID=UPI001C584EBD|nr:hypothetical protein [Ferrimonas balearica]MBW3165463.1 hypothetical protein [Ferrimonas balearica]MBY6107643.1 hypothetical protein [Ferrimonas balearica]MBY6226639.1 hypothetical protein [Ferrimonas balearica]